VECDRSLNLLQSFRKWTGKLTVKIHFKVYMRYVSGFTTNILYDVEMLNCGFDFHYPEE